MEYLWRPPFTQKKSNIKVDIWHPVLGRRCRNPPRKLSQLKTRANLQVGKNFAVRNIFFHGIFIETSLHNLISNFKFDIWHNSVGLRCRNPTQSLKSIKDPGNIFDLHCKWTGTSPSLIYFSWDIYRDPPPSTIFFFKYQSWYWTTCFGFEVKKPPSHLSQ